MCIIEIYIDRQERIQYREVVSELSLMFTCIRTAVSTIYVRVGHWKWHRANAASVIQVQSYVLGQ